MFDPLSNFKLNKIKKGVDSVKAAVDALPTSLSSSFTDVKNAISGVGAKVDSVGTKVDASNSQLVDLSYRQELSLLDTSRLLLRKISSKPAVGPSFFELTGRGKMFMFVANSVSSGRWLGFSVYADNVLLFKSRAMNGSCSGVVHGSVLNDVTTNRVSTKLGLVFPVDGLGVFDLDKSTDGITSGSSPLLCMTKPIEFNNSFRVMAYQVENNPVIYAAYELEE